MRKFLVLAGSVGMLCTLPALAQDIVIGQSVALSGSNADIGRDMRDGALAIFNKANASKTLPRPIKLVTLDNANSRDRARENAKALIEQHNATALFGFNSATNSMDALPMVQKANMLFFAPFSGSLAVRSSPNVYTVRASYKEETAKVIESKRAVGSEKAVVLYYDDEVGRSNYETVASAYTEAGAAKPSGVGVKRGAKLEPANVDALLAAGAHYVLATTQFSVVADLLKATGEKGAPVSIAALSFVNPDELAESVGPAARGTMVSQVIPAPRGANLVSTPLVKECADALQALNGAKLNYTSLESCIAAQALVAAIRKAGPRAATREGLLQAMDTVGRVDLNGYVLNFGPNHRHGSSWVELTMLSRGNRFVH